MMEPLFLLPKLYLWHYEFGMTWALRSSVVGWAMDEQANFTTCSSGWPSIWAWISRNALETVVAVGQVAFVEGREEGGQNAKCSGLFHAIHLEWTTDFTSGKCNKKKDSKSPPTTSSSSSSLFFRLSIDGVRHFNGQVEIVVVVGVLATQISKQVLDRWKWPQHQLQTNIGPEETDAYSKRKSIWQGDFASWKVFRSRNGSQFFDASSCPGTDLSNKWKQDNLTIIKG